MSDIYIVPSAAEYAEGFQHVVDRVARERAYLGFVRGFSVDVTRAFISRLIAQGDVQLLAVDNCETVIGWCDIERDRREGFQHVGRLGMGIAPELRERGIGTKLALRAIEVTRSRGIERIELEVYASNERAIGLYRTLGFVEEGIKRRARKLDGSYDDNVLMALFLT